MRSMFFLTLIIVLVSGLIAYVGDLIGRKMGRKRLSLFGLRPRYTAIVISVGMGMLIAAITLSATFIVNKRVREAFFTPLEKLRAEISDFRLRASQAEAEVSTKTQMLKKTDDQLRHSQSQQQQIQHQLNTAESSLTTAQGELQLKQRNLNAINGQLNDVNKQLMKAKKEYQRISAELTRVQKKRHETTTVLMQTTKELDKLGEDVTRLQLQKKELEDELRTAASEFVMTSFAPLTFEQGQEILSGVFPAAGSQASREQLLEKFFATAEKIVRQRSPQMPADSPAFLFFRAGSGNMEHLDSLTLKEASAILAKKIGEFGAREQVLLRLTPANNVPVNRAAIIIVDQLELKANNVVYAAGNELARIEIDVTPHTTAADVLGSLVDNLLREQVPDALRKQQMAMILRRFDPEKPTVIPPATMSMVAWSDLLAAADKVCKQTGKVTIVARTHDNLHRFDPLELTLDVIPRKP